MLDKRKAERDISKYMSYDELRDYVRKKEIKTKNDYVNHLRYNIISEYDGKNIPYNPPTFYSKDIWEGWSVFLRDEIYKKNYNGTYYNYKECKKAVAKYNFLSKNDFSKRISSIIKEDIRIPYNPYYIYKKEWECWNSFLNTNNIAYQIKNLVDFEVARAYARSLNLKLQKQWFDIKFIDLPVGMTTHPDRVYIGKGWVDWYDFLGINQRTKMSYGEVIISNFLDSICVKYNYDKSLKGQFLNPPGRLRFDFYLLDQNICIEFDGKQHFEPIDCFGGVEEFERVKLRDNIKNDWCKLHEIKLIRLRYDQSSSEIIETLKEQLSV